MKSLHIGYGKSKVKPWALFVAALCLCAVLMAMGFIQNHRVTALSRQVNAAYQKSFYETVALMSSVQLNLEKLLVSGANRQEQMLLTTIAQQAEGAQSNLAALPINPELLGATMKFVNQVSDYSRALSKQLSAGSNLSEHDVRQLITLHDTSVELNDSLQGLLSQYERGELVFEVTDTSVKAVRDLQQESQPMVEYPVLLYDGPFSDSRPEGAILLSGPTVDAAQAQEALLEFIGRDRVSGIKFSGESNVLDKCFEFEVQTENGMLTAGVTQKGGHVLYVLPEQGNTEVLLSQGECIDMAQRFLMSRGYGPMDVSYWRQLGGVLTVNFAAVQQGVMMYPDLVKLQVSMKDGLVVGIETGSYLKNHRERELVVPVFTKDEALNALGAVLTADRVRQCVIPTESGGEEQCWEISAHMNGEARYLVYFDVVTGEEQSILRVMVEDDGILTQ